MLEEKKPTYMYFDTDDDFYNFCVVPVINVDANTKTTSFDFSNKYKNALENNVYFIIKNEDSQIYKRKAVSYRTITRPVQNMLPYYGEEINI